MKLIHGGNITCLEAELLSEKEIEHKPYGAGTFVALLHYVSPGLTVDLRTGVLYKFIDYNLVFHTLKAISCYSFLLPGPHSPNTYVGCCFCTVTSLYILVSQHKVQNNSSQLESQDVLILQLY